MRIIHVKSAGVLEGEARKKLEGIFYPDVTTAVADLKHQFPNHVVSVSDDCIRVTNRDGSVNVAVFKEEEAQKNWVETDFGLRDMNEQSS